MRKMSVILIMVGTVLAALPSSYNQPEYSQSEYRLLGEITNEPAWGWTHWWTGVGDLADFTITNTVQGGYFGRKWHQYHPYPVILAENDQPDTAQYGNVGEYPAGSKQYYIYACGLWFGAMYPAEIDGTDTTWEPNVVKGAYRCDMGAMSVPEMEQTNAMSDIHVIGLYFSNMIIPSGIGYNHEGQMVFVVPGMTPKDFQDLWPFADTSLNKYRPAGQKLDPANGDWVSHEDTYAVGGDWIPENEAVGVWVPYKPDDWPGDSLRDYGLQSLGVRVEQRTYSWARGALRNTIVLNFKIRNMNDFPLKAPYFSYFMDNDIGHSGSNPGDDGGWDDRVGYDAAHKVVYTYDDNNFESGWDNDPGYIGCIFLETPGDVGVTGCESWENDSYLGEDADSIQLDSEHLGDDKKYERMISTNFVPHHPSDVRMLLNSGPYPEMAPADEYNYTVAIVVGDDLNDLFSNIDSVRTLYTNGFLPWIAIEEDELVKEPVGLRLVSATVTSREVQIRYSLPYTCNVNLSVFDASGRRVQALEQGASPAGESEAAWDASEAASGVYFVRLLAAGEARTARVLILK